MKIWETRNHQNPCCAESNLFTFRLVGFEMSFRASHWKINCATRFLAKFWRFCNVILVFCIRFFLNCCCAILLSVFFELIVFAILKQSCSGNFDCATIKLLKFSSNCPLFFAVFVFVRGCAHPFHEFWSQVNLLLILKLMLQLML